MYAHCHYLMIKLTNRQLMYTYTLNSRYHILYISGTTKLTMSACMFGFASNRIYIYQHFYIFFNPLNSEIFRLNFKYIYIYIYIYYML